MITWAPDAVVGELKKKNTGFTVLICTKTIYNMIDRGDFCRLTNQNLPIKRNKTSRTYKPISRVAKNNITGRSIEKWDEKINRREEVGQKGNGC